MQTLGYCNSLVENINTPRSQNTHNEEIFVLSAVHRHHKSLGGTSSKVQCIQCGCMWGHWLLFLLVCVKVLHSSQRFVHV